MSLKQPVSASAPEPQDACEALQAGRAHDVAGCLEAATASYEKAVRLAEAAGERTLLVEGLRRLAVVRHRSGDPEGAHALCTRSYRESLALGEPNHAGEALNTLAGFDFEAGEMAASRAGFQRALALSHGSASLAGRIEQNLGILDSVQGEHDDAFGHYHRALEAFRQAGDHRGCAIAYHNLGLIWNRRGDLNEAERALAQSAALAGQVGDRYLGGLCELHRAEVSHARRYYTEALARCESALESFERIGDRRAMSDAYKVIGKVLRESGNAALAEVRLKTAVSLAVETGWVLGQAEAERELARLHQGNGKKQEALALLKNAHGLFGRLQARLELVDIEQRITELAA